MAGSFFRQALLVLLALFLAAGRTLAAPGASLEMEYLCAWLSLASYSDRVGEMAREELAANGFVMVPFREEDRRAAASYYLLERRTEEGSPFYLLAVTGTKDRKDIKLDLSLRKVPFAGDTPEAFLAAAARSEMEPSEPLVHSGFNAYTQTAFFSPKPGTVTLGEQLRDALLEDEGAHLCITGHSLGGAVAILLSARLMAMGVPPEQLTVVAFGAPAVGNEAFAAAHEAMALRRVVMAGDPVGAAVQAFDKSYTPFGEVVRFQQARGEGRFPHEMVGYVDAVLRAYYKAEDLPSAAPDEAAAEGTADIYMAMSLKLPELFAADAPLWRHVAARLVQRHLPGVYVGGAATLAEAKRQAAALGCSYVLWQEYEMQREKERREAYQVTLQESLFDGAGNMLMGQSFTTNTGAMTPLLAALYNVSAGRDSRIEALEQEAILGGG